MIHKISNIVLLIITCAVTSNVAAQVFMFDKMYDEGGWEIALDIYENEDSSIISLFSTIDFTASDSTYNERLYCSKLNSKGEIVKTAWLTPSEAEFLGCSGIERIGTELFFVATFRKTDTTQHSSPFISQGIYLNTNGDTLRTFTIVHPIFDTVHPGWSVPTRTQDGKFISSHLYKGYKGDSMFVFLNDSSGNLIWVKEFRDLHVYVSSIMQTLDKGYLLSGYEFDDEWYVPQPDGGMKYSGHPERLWYGKLDSMGNMMYQRKFTGSGYELYDTVYHRYSIDQMNQFWTSTEVSDGNYVLAGGLAKNPYMVKVDSKGTILWERKYFSKFNYLDSFRRESYFKRVKEVNGALYALGYYDSLEVGASKATAYYFLMKLTLSGKVEWLRYFKGDGGNYLYELTPGLEGFFLTGSKDDTIPKHGLQDGWILKVNSFGCLLPNCNSNDVIDTITSLIEPRRLSFSSNVYPNPGNGRYSIDCVLNQGVIVTIYDVNGRIVFNEKNTRRIDISNQPCGVYLLQIRDADGNLLSSHKLIKSNE